MGAPPPEWTLVARLGRPRGLRGEIYADSDASPERMAALTHAWLRTEAGEWRNGGEPIGVDSVCPYKGRWVFTFTGYESIEAVEPFAHCEALLPATARPAPAAGEFYLADLVGCEVVDRASGSQLGTVSGWQEFGGPALLEVLPVGGQPQAAVWIPFAKAICVEIDPAGRRIVVDPPAGLLELNKPVKDES